MECFKSHHGIRDFLDEAMILFNRKRSIQTHPQELANTFFSDRTQAGKKIIVTTGRLGILDSCY
jgi:hypothetical protein